MNSKGILKFDWSRVTFLSGGGLHYGQEPFGEELCTWMKNGMAISVATYFWRGVFRRSSFLGNLKALDKKLGLRRTST